MRFIVLSAFFISFKCLHAQRIVGFNLYPSGTGISVKFGIAPGATCNGYSIYHCLDSVNYVEIENYPTICGTSGTTENYSYTHNNPIANVYNYYKLQLFPYEIAYRKILFSPNDRGSVIAFPNPVFQGNNMLHLRIGGANNLKMFGYIFTINARPLREIEMTTNADLLNISIAGFENGVYLVWLTDGARAYSTKFIVAN